MKHHKFYTTTDEVPYLPTILTISPNPYMKHHKFYITTDEVPYLPTILTIPPNPYMKHHKFHITTDEVLYLPTILTIPPMMMMRKLLQEQHRHYTSTTHEVSTNSAKHPTNDDFAESVAGVPWTVHEIKYLPIVLKIPLMIMSQSLLQEWHGHYTRTTDNVSTNSAHYLLTC